MIGKFSDYSRNLTEARKNTAVFCFGRMNPPTTGHAVVIDKVIKTAQARNGDHFVFLSKTQDPKKNPLTHEQKVSYARKFFPNANISKEKILNPYHAVLHLCKLGYKHIIVVTGSDHLADYNKIKEYKGKKASMGDGSYSFDELEVVIAGEARDDDASGVAGMSASKMRKAAFDGDYKQFAMGVPKTSPEVKKKMFNDVRKAMNLKEEYLPEAKGGNDKITILALTSSQNDLSDTIEKMEKICKKKGIPFYGVKTSKAQVEISSVITKRIKIKNYDGDENDVVIDPANTVCVVRGGVMNSDIGVAIMTILQNNGVFMINERGGMELCANKLETAIALKKHNLPHPRTAFVTNEENVESAVKEVGGKFPIIVKTLTGAEGIGVSKIESLESLKSVLQTLWKYGAEVILQEFLPNFKNDVRSIVLNGKIFACAKRDKAPKDFRTNIARGSKGGSFQLSEEEIKLVEEAARVSKCYYVGIDHVINDGKPYIIEMNASPGSGNIYYRYYEEGKGKDNVKGEELVEDFVNYITEKSHWKLFSNLSVREKVKIDGVEYDAKIDTGNSGYNMIHGDDIKDNGDHTVTFKLPSGKKVTKKIVSRITVKSGIGSKQRMVVLMDVEFHGKHYPNIKFSVGDRSHMSTKVLFGLQFLSKTGQMVDPADAIYPQNQTPQKGQKRGEEEEEKESVSEANIGKDKEYTTKTGKTKGSPKDSETGMPKKYVSGMSKAAAAERKKKLAARKDAPDDDPKTWKFTDPKEKDIKTEPSQYTKAFQKLAKKGGAIKALKNQVEVDRALMVIEGMSQFDYSDRISKAILMEQWAIRKGELDAAATYREYINLEKQEAYSKYNQSSLDEDVDYLLCEVSPPSGPARRFSKKEKIKKEFQKRYGKRWKEVFYATAWKIHNDSFEPEGDMIESAINRIHQEIVVEGAWDWTAKGKRGPLLIGTDKIANTYKHDTPGERERLDEVADEEKDGIYKEWSKLVNMSAKELSDFIDSEEGEEAGLSRKESGKAGASGGKIKSGRDSARAIVRMLERKKDSWNDNDWEWAKRQINFINRMKGAKGSMREPDGKPTRKLLALKIWGHNPEK